MLCSARRATFELFLLLLGLGALAIGALHTVIGLEWHIYPVRQARSAPELDRNRLAVFRSVTPIQPRDGVLFGGAKLSNLEYGLSHTVFQDEVPAPAEPKYDELAICGEAPRYNTAQTDPISVVTLGHP